MYKITLFLPWVNLYLRYYKKFEIPDMGRVNVKLSQSNVQVAHANNTLIITVSSSSYLWVAVYSFMLTYQTFWTGTHLIPIPFLFSQYNKPPEILQFEKQLEEEFKKVKTMRDGDVDQCSQS